MLHRRATLLLIGLFLLSLPVPSFARPSRLAGEVKEALELLEAEDPAAREEAEARLRSASSDADRHLVRALEREFSGKFRAWRRQARKVNRLVRFIGKERAEAGRQKLLEAWNEARSEALSVIYDKTVYRDEDHGASGQRLVNEKTLAVEKIFSQLDRAVRRDLSRIARLRGEKARELLDEVLLERDQVVRLHRLLDEVGSDEAKTELPTCPPAILAMLRFQAGEGDLSEAPGGTDRYLDYLRQRLADVAVMSYNESILRSRAEDGVRPTAHEANQVRLTNEYRILMGRRAVELSFVLTESARSHAQEMHRLNYFDHTSPVAKNRTPSDRARQAGYPEDVGENIAKGSISPGQVHRAWLTSAPHHRNLLSPDYTAMGSGRHGEYWVQNFGSYNLFRK